MTGQILLLQMTSTQRVAINTGQGLLKKYMKLDPLICPKCGGNMRIIAFIEDYKVIRKILDYLGIYEFERDRPPPREFTVVEVGNFFCNTVLFYSAINTRYI